MGTAWAKVLFGVAVPLLSLSIVLPASEWWQLVTIAVMIVLGIVLLISGVRDLFTLRRDGRIATGAIPLGE